jgi:hypothetical protein
MKMIELKWVMVEGFRTLVYRYRYPLRNDNIQKYPMEWDWSKWEKVPEVEDER